MTDVKKQMLDETVENLKHLDTESLLIVKSGTELLRARDLLDKKSFSPESDKQNRKQDNRESGQKDGKGGGAYVTNTNDGNN